MKHLKRFFENKALEINRNNYEDYFLELLDYGYSLQGIEELSNTIVFNFTYDNLIDIESPLDTIESLQKKIADNEIYADILEILIDIKNRLDNLVRFKIRHNHSYNIISFSLSPLDKEANDDISNIHVSKRKYNFPTKTKY